jgi:hypothetical protein
MREKQISTTLTEEIPEWKLKLAYFYSLNKEALKRGGIFLLFFADLLIVFVFGSIFIGYQTNTLNNDNQLRLLGANLINHQMVIDNFRPEELQIVSQELVSAGLNKYDALALIKNNNSGWAINELTYTFVVGGETLAEQKTFVLPKSEKYLMQFNIKDEGPVVLKIVGAKWHRMADYSLVSHKDDIKIVKSSYTPSASPAITGEVEVTIKNDGPLSFWEVGVPIILYNSYNQPIGINYLTVNKLQAQETRTLKLSWLDLMVERVTRVEAGVEVNLLDKGSIMKIEAPIGPPKGLEN